MISSGIAALVLFAMVFAVTNLLAVHTAFKQEDPSRSGKKRGPGKIGL